MATQAPIPELLWHYTDANGTFGILESRQFRFGDAAFLNDRSERSYNYNVISDVCNDDHLHGPPRRPHRLMNRLRWHLLNAAPRERLFVCSFSETTESISQWQRYGSDGSGYCLGFTTAGLDTLFQTDVIQRVPMMYAKHDQDDWLRQKIRLAADIYQQKATALTARPDGNIDDDTFAADPTYAAALRDVHDAALQIKTLTSRTKESGDILRELMRVRLTVATRSSRYEAPT